MAKSVTGVEREYYPSGELMSEVFVNNGIREGEYKDYYENGQICVIYNYIKCLFMVISRNNIMAIKLFSLKNHF